MASLVSCHTPVGWSREPALSPTDFGPCHFFCFCVCALSCPALCNPMDCSQPVSSIHGISQASILEWVASPLQGDLFPNPGIEPTLPESLVLAGRFFTTAPPGFLLGHKSRNKSQLPYVRASHVLKGLPPGNLTASPRCHQSGCW